MSKRQGTYDHRCLNLEQVQVAGSFAPNGSSAVDATSNKGKGWTVARTGTGVFTLTLAEKWAEMFSAIATVQLNAAADTAIQVGAYDATNRTLILRSITAGSAADIAANANNRINFSLQMTRSKVAA